MFNATLPPEAAHPKIHLQLRLGSKRHLGHYIRSIQDLYAQERLRLARSPVVGGNSWFRRSPRHGEGEMAIGIGGASEARHRKVIDVYGCFFHMHKCKYGAVVPVTNATFWRNKRLSNVERDRRNLRTLRREGWKVMVVWECETRRLELLSRRLEKFLAAS